MVHASVAPFFEKRKNGPEIAVYYIFYEGAESSVYAAADKNCFYSAAGKGPQFLEVISDYTDPGCFQPAAVTAQTGTDFFSRENT
ncbi:hypothetical protein K7I13_10570 [Brucepastera parasyntrophica]|uniref:hypothetical protein n=1 Tax=Brucepastera parasyntrophica TaxID=2880008 RepID=UPI00210B60E2|nr:hypothetical protein [Brucepastera parasyntrophica]ULQ58959.1 hypothetical protein K7I13_10570 [Brucepastera parasyntrophica]